MPGTEVAASGAFTVYIGGLEVSISGPLSEASALLQHLQAFDFGARGSSSAGETVGDLLESSDPLPARGASRAAGPSESLAAYSSATYPSSGSSPLPQSTSDRVTSSSSYPLQARRATASESRSEIARGFPSCPEHWLSRASSLPGGPLSGRDRILRAWEAGCWAGAVLAGRIGTPSTVRSIALQSRIYAVVGGGTTPPAICRSFREYSLAIGPLQNSPSVSHGFPSELEARVYFAGSGVQWPEA